MFERYTEKARRTIFFARYEASQWGDPMIRPEHLFLALMREDKQLLNKVLPSLQPSAALWEELGLKQTGAKLSTSIDLPLSEESKRVLAFGAEESERLGHSAIDTGHLVLALLREPGPARDLLIKRGLILEALRAKLNTPPGSAAAGNEEIVKALRSAFRTALGGRITPDLEPAVTYKARLEKEQ